MKYVCTNVNKQGEFCAINIRVRTKRHKKALKAQNLLAFFSALGLALTTFCLSCLVFY